MSRVSVLRKIKQLGLVCLINTNPTHPNRRYFGKLQKYFIALVQKCPLS